VIIDVHAHLSPPSSARRYPMPPSLTDVDGMLAARAAAGIDLTVIGSPVGAGAMMRVPGVDNYTQSRDQLRAFHDWMAGLIGRFPDQLRGYVYANPLGDADHLDGVRETLANPAFVGLVINSSVRGRYLDGEAAGPFFALAAETGKPILVHPPAEPADAAAVTDLRFVEQVSRFNDVTAGLAMLACAGWLDRFPGLTVIGAGGGGAIAALPEKLDAVGGAGAAVRRLFVDTASPSAAHLGLNVGVLGAGQVLLGTDSPPVPVPPAATVARIRALPLDQAAIDAILGGTAARIFGLRPALAGGVR
jgi:aminocarboxymuconate-semialdehyde decarboxylase